MNVKKTILLLFVLVALAQLYVPAKMILDREDILDTGAAYQFRTAPVDPYDPFRGKYITLYFQDNIADVPEGTDWVRGETVYALLTTDEEGFAKIASVSKEPPAGNTDFLKTEVSFVTFDNINRMAVDFPFDRYYMEESKAEDAEQLYRDSARDSDQETYALVYVKDGNAVLKDVLIDGVPIKEVVKASRTP